MPRDIRVYLYDIQRVANEIVQYTDGMTLEVYQADGKTRRAVERCLAIIGEALVQARQRGLGATACLPHLQSVIDLRNFLVHEYSKINDDIIWQILKQHLPGLLKAVDAMLESEQA